MTDDLIACGNGCKDADESGTLHPRLTEQGRSLCEPCCDRLWRWLDDLVDQYVRLGPAILLGSVEQNPESKKSLKRADRAPLRIDPVDLSDERHYLIGGSLPTENVRGIVGVLQKWANQIRVQQGSPTLATPTLPSELTRLTGSFDFLVRQPYAPSAYASIKSARRKVKDAIGEYQQKPVGRCPVIVHDEDSDTSAECAGPLWPANVGVRCGKCGSVWTNEHLHMLRMAMAT